MKVEVMRGGRLQLASGRSLKHRLLAAYMVRLDGQQVHWGAAVVAAAVWAVVAVLVIMLANYY